MTRHFPDAHAFLAGRQSGEMPIYVIGGRTERRVTLYSQQCRALNLVAAIDCVYGQALRDMRVAVVGAGAAGMIAATALRGRAAVPGESTRALREGAVRGERTADLPLSDD